MKHHVDVPIRWGDMDAYGHVNNVTYLRYLEEARLGAFTAWFTTDVVGAGIVVARVEIEYVSPLEHRAAPVRVDVWVSDVRGASFALDYVVRDPDPDATGDAAGTGTTSATVYARATTTLVLFDPETGSPRRIGPELRAELARHTDAPVTLRGRR